MKVLNQKGTILGAKAANHRPSCRAVQVAAV